ncbi:hypothetical protein P7C73_g612, partial [Tremellales sp. Uapishka_1]
MPPRLPAVGQYSSRSPIPVLDFLLPWSKRWSSSVVTAVAAVAEAGPSVHQPPIPSTSRIAPRMNKSRVLSIPSPPTPHFRKARARLYPRPSLSPPISSSTSTSTSTMELAPAHHDYVATQLRRPRPPPPHRVLAELSSQPSLLTLAGGRLLRRYADRVNDGKVSRATVALLARERIGGSVENHRPAERRQKVKIKPTKRPNKRLLLLHPPLATLPDHPTPTQTLQHIHHQLLQSPSRSAPPLDTNLVSSLSPDDRLSLLHLYIAYSPSPLSFLPHIPHPTRQTLHLLVLSLLRSSRPTVTDLQVIFERCAVQPGLETWRHVARYAYGANDDQLAEYAYRNWRISDARTKGGRQRKGKGVGEEERDDRGGGQLDEGGDIRFGHLGQNRARWIKLMNKYEDRGWIRRIRLEWVWTGREGAKEVVMERRWEQEGRELEQRMWDELEREAQRAQKEGGEDQV